MVKDWKDLDELSDAELADTLDRAAERAGQRWADEAEPPPAAREARAALLAAAGRRVRASLDNGHRAVKEARPSRIVLEVDNLGRLIAWHDSGRTVPVILRSGAGEQAIQVPSNIQTELAILVHLGDPEVE